MTSRKIKEELEGVEEEPQEDDQEAEEREDPKLVTYRMAIPLPVKDQKEILSAIQQMYIQLRIHGYHVARLHTDLGGEFRSRSLKQWCRSRDIQLTTTAGVSSQANGRAERAIQTIKGHIRRLLGMAGMDSSMWAYACHYVHERERKRMADKDMKDLPPFGQELLVKNRFWKTKELEGTHEKVRYLAPRPDAHGHLVLRDDGNIVIAPYFNLKTVEPEPSQETWMAVVRAAEEEEDPHVARRRIRGKMTMKSMKKEDEDEYDKILRERKKHGEKITNVILEESVIMLKDEMKVTDVVFEELKKVKGAATQEEEPVLRTRIVSPRELLQEAPKWVKRSRKNYISFSKKRRHSKR